MKNLKTMMVSATVALTMMATTAIAKEDIYIQSPYSASHGGVPAYLAIIEEANKIQDEYEFHLENKPGGQQIIAIKQLDQSPQNRLGIIAPKYVEHTKSGKLNRDDYVPIHALGSACWVVISNLGDSIEAMRNAKKETMTVGGVGIGNATHLTSLQIGEAADTSVNYVIFKSNYEGLILMAGDGSVNMVVEKAKNYLQMKTKNPNIQAAAASCTTRHPLLPDTATLAEQGVQAPQVFNITVASTKMPTTKRLELGRILNMATKNLGKEKVFGLSDMNSPVFDNVAVGDFYLENIATVETLLDKHANKIKK
jgi:tripartite-type tricarboxylate transporter receptor subunit TctC